ncbi:MAG: (deoxy)nucleoside triphosphate pyrophosphohydrolase [Oscillospiraceae bacterium]|nr:(deoxy)nucleoside triphosphate pyrophosphohydrolase [Oscillospiraceae bacterium]
MTEASKRKTVRVAAAVLLKDGRVFATQRGYGPYRDWWEFPGGKIEKGETPEEALRREIREELDTEIRVGELFEEVEYDYPDFHLSMKCFLADVISGHLVLREHEDARWLPPERLDDVQWLPADLSVVDRLKRRLLQTE